MTVMYCTLMWMCLKCVRVKERERKRAAHAWTLYRRLHFSSSSNCLALKLSHSLYECTTQRWTCKMLRWGDLHSMFLSSLMKRCVNVNVSSQEFRFQFDFLIVSLYTVFTFSCKYVILCMYITYMGMQLQSASPVFVCVGATDTILLPQPFVERATPWQSFH